MVWLHLELNKTENKIVGFWKINCNLRTKALAVKDIINRAVKK